MLQAMGSCYEQLDLGNRQIRLLRLLSGTFSTPICCEIYTAFLDDYPHFEALSYAWGDDIHCDQICVNGQPTPLRNNLAAALRRLRHRAQKRYL